MKLSKLIEIIKTEIKIQVSESNTGHNLANHWANINLYQYSQYINDSSVKYDENENGYELSFILEIPFAVIYKTIDDDATIKDIKQYLSYNSKRSYGLALPPGHISGFCKVADIKIRSGIYVITMVAQGIKSA